MPGGDGTGPMGQGPMTGRGMGYCAGNDRPGFASPGLGRGAGRGFGRGFRRFWRWNVPVQQPYPAQTKEQEKLDVEAELRAIEQEEKAMQSEKEALKKRLDEIGQ